MVLKKTALAAGILLATSQMAYANDLNINGFMSVGVGTSDSKVKINGMDNGANFTNDAVVGLQISKRLNDTTSATTQLIARGDDGFNSEAAWAYITYSASDNTDVRIGRLRTPFFYYSDFLEVGYAYNWIRPVTEVYGTLEPFSSLNAVDVTHNFSFGRNDGSVQAYYGRYDGDFDLPVGLNLIPTSISLEDAMGVVFSATRGNFGTRLSYHQASVTANIGAAPTPQIDDRITQFYQAALTFDNGDIAAIAEATQLKHRNGGFTDEMGYLISVAKRLNDTTLHLTYSGNEDKPSSKYNQLQDEKQSSVILGARFDYDAATAFKIEAQHTEYDEGTANSKKVSGMTYSASVQLVF
ncbi:MAG: porin [Bacterioplanes sp.]|nr:porin [Bacterioplanes sp.]